jgi:hypothetical protein
VRTWLNENDSLRNCSYKPHGCEQVRLILKTILEAIISRIKSVAMSSWKAFSVILLFLAVSLALLRKLILQPGIIGFRSDWIFPLSGSQATNQVLNNLYVLHPNIGQTMNPYYIYDAVFAFLSAVLSTSFASKAILMLSLVMGGISLYYLSRTLLLEKAPSIIAGFFYMTTPVLFNQFRIGHATYIFSYAIAPLVVALFIRSVAKEKINLKLVVAAGLIYAISWVQLQFSVMILSILVLYSVFIPPKHKKIRSMFTLFCIVSIAAFIHMQWILPSLLSSPIEFKAISNNSYLEHMSPTLIDALRLKGYVIPSFEESVASGRIIPLSFWTVISFVLPALVFLPLLIDRKKVTIFFTILAVSTLFFAKGTNPPLGSVYIWLNSNFSLMSSFREIYHITFILSLSYAILIGITLQKVMLISGQNRCFMSKLKLLRYHKVIVAAPLILLICISSWPLLTGDFNGTVQTYQPSENYENAIEYLSGLNGDFRVAWLPMTSALYYEDSKFFDTTRDPIIVYSLKPAIDADTRTYNRFYAFLQRIVETGRTSYLAEMLASAGVKYVITRENVRSRYSEIWNQTLFIDGQSDFTLVRRYGDVRIFENTRFKAPIWSTDNFSLGVGDLSLLISLPYFYDLKSEDPPSVFFLGQQSLTNLEFLTSLTDRILISGSDYYDYIFSFLPAQFIFDPAQFATQWWPYLGWSPYFYNWGIDPEEINSINQGVITVVNDSFSIPFFAQSEGLYEVWAKVYYGEKGGRLNFSVNNNSLEVITKSPYANGLRWAKVGPLQLKSGMHSLAITSEDGMNIVDVVFIMPSDSFRSSMAIAQDTLRGKRITIINEFEKIGGNKYLIPTRKWGNNASDGAALESNAPTEFAGTLMLPKSGNYTIDIRTNRFWAISSLRVNGKSISINDNGQDDNIKTIENFDSVAGWAAVDAAVSLSTEYEKSEVFSLNFGFAINKSKGRDHWIYKVYSNANVSNYDKICFWIYPKTQTRYAESEVSFHLQNLAGEWYETNLYLKNNEWNYVHLDLPEWKNKSSIAAIRFLVGDKWGTYEDQQKVNLYIDDLKVYRAKEESFNWTLLSGVYLNEGNNTISFNVDIPNVGLDLIAVESLNDQSKDTDSSYKSTTFERINPTKYTVCANAFEPFFLVFSDTYHKDWVAYVDGQQVPSEYHFVANGFANAWYINRTGTYTITLEFWPQKLFYIGSAIAVSTFLVCLTYLAYNYTKNKNIWKQIKAALATIINRRKTTKTKPINHTKNT